MKEVWNLVQQLKEESNQYRTSLAKCEKTLLETRARLAKCEEALQETRGQVSSQDEALGGIRTGQQENRALLDKHDERLEKYEQRLNDYDESLSEVHEDNNKPDHLPEILLRVKGKALGGLWVACHVIQGLQIWLVTFLMHDGACVQVSEIKDWSTDGLLESQNGTIACYSQNGTVACYSDGDNVDILAAFRDGDDFDLLAAFRDGTIVLSNDGFRTSWMNIAVGLVLLGSFQMSELSAIFMTNEYHAKDWTFIPATSVLIGQIFVCFWVAFACGQSVVTSSLDTVATMQASTVAFFVLDIDDQLLDPIWSCFRHRGATLYNYWNALTCEHV